MEPMISNKIAQVSLHQSKDACAVIVKGISRNRTGSRNLTVPGADSWSSKKKCRIKIYLSELLNERDLMTDQVPFEADTTPLSLVIS